MKRKRSAQHSAAQSVEPIGAQHSAARPVEPTVCVITYDEPMHHILTRADPKLDLLLSFKTAVDQDPDLIVVCLNQMGASYQMTSDLMSFLHKVLEGQQRNGKARPLVDDMFTSGVLCLFFTQPELLTTVDPEEGFPAVLCVIDSLVVVAASWPVFPMRVGHRLLQAYLREARRCVEQPAGIVVAGNFGMHVMHADSLASRAGCLAAAQGSSFVFVTDGLVNASMRFLQVDEPCVSLVQGQSTARWVPSTKRRKNEHSAEQPAPRKDPVSGLSTASKAVVLRERTPLYDNFLDSMQKAEAGTDILDFLGTECFWGRMCYYDKKGQECLRPFSIAWKMEVMLGEVLEQRKLHIDRLNKRAPPWSSPDSMATLKFTEDDMKEIMNSWRLNVESWMQARTLAVYHDSPKWHQIGKSAFSTFLQHLSGCKFLLRRLIASPLLAEGAGVAQPGAIGNPQILRELTQEWADHKNSEEHKNAIKMSQPRRDQERLSKRLHQAQVRCKQGARLLHLVLDNSVDWCALSEDEQQMVEDYESRRSTKILDDLFKEKREAQPYRGAGVVLQ
jgi:hypothetical protein